MAIWAPKSFSGQSLGRMRGLINPLKSFKFVRRYSKISETGEVLEDGPRLEPWTNGWHLDSMSRWLVNDETGERSSHDPRLAPKASKSVESSWMNSILSKGSSACRQIRCLKRCTSGRCRFSPGADADAAFDWKEVTGSDGFCWRYHDDSVTEVKLTFWGTWMLRMGWYKALSSPVMDATAVSGVPSEQSPEFLLLTVWKSKGRSKFNRPWETEHAKAGIYVACQKHNLWVLRHDLGSRSKFEICSHYGIVHPTDCLPFIYHK